MGLAFLGGLGVTIVLGLSLHLFTNAIPKLARIAAVKAARRLPAAMKLNQEAAWLADLACLETHFEILSCAVACWITSYSVLPPFVREKSYREFMTARRRLQAHGAIVNFALNRLKAWQVPADANKWSFFERWFVGVIFASKEPIEKCMKDYITCLERDLRERPRQYESKEEAAKELFLPISREMKVFQFLRKHDLGLGSSVSLDRKPRSVSCGAKDE